MSEEQVNAIYKVTDEGIYGFFKEHRFLSNFHLCDIPYEGIIYPSTEGAYQCAKIFYPEDSIRTLRERSEIALMSPTKIKAEGRRVNMRPDWEEVKQQVMLDVTRIKYKIPELRDKLLATGNKYLEETNWWKDRTWGVYEGKGRNLLGTILMQVRNEVEADLYRIE